MISGKIQRFRTVDELQKYLDDYTSSLKKESEELAETIGEKLRSTESAKSSDLEELRTKIEGSNKDPKKKKSTKKTDRKTNWYNFDSISIYDGIGIKGELEIYFKIMEESKKELEKAVKIKQKVDEIINRGLKRDLGCVLCINQDSPAEIAFISPVVPREKFSFRSIFEVPMEETCEIKI